jgi:DNA-binding transcriptional LysR family regulator
MDLRQLEYFVTVADEASFTRAASRLYVSQPGISAQIRQLELELGEALLDRSTRSVRLTEVGTAVMPYARAALAAAAGIRSVVGEMSGQARGRVAVGMMNPSISAFDVPGLLASFHRRYPGIELMLSMAAASDHIVAALQTGQLDVGFVGLTETAEPGPGIATLTVAEQPLVAVAAPGDPLLAGGDVELEALRERTLIGLPRGTGLRTALDEACAGAGFQPRIAFEAADPHLAAQLAAQGLGVALLPAAVAADHRDEVQAAAIRGPSLVVRVALVWRSEGPIDPATRAFISHTRSVMEDWRSSSSSSSSSSSPA